MSVGIKKINIVVPVYNQLDLTRACLTSVLCTIDRSVVDIVVIDDASTDRALQTYLRGLHDCEEIILITNSRNKGFTRSVNLGMAHNAGRDVILLNTDTIVYRDWVERLHRAACSDERIGTVNPLTNFGGSHIAFYPNAEQDLDIEVDHSSLDWMARNFNAGALVYSHTTVGFCMYIKRTCINELGYFDVEHFPRAYGEEADFCYRASYLGWKHAISSDVFVSHFHGKSFGIEKEKLMGSMLETFRALHPKFYEVDASFWKIDPMKSSRQSLDLARLSNLTIDDGELQIFCDLESTACSKRLALVYNSETRRLTFKFGLDLQGFFDLPNFLLPHDINLLAATLRKIGVKRITYFSEESKARLEASTVGERYETKWSEAMSDFEIRLR